MRVLTRPGDQPQFVVLNQVGMTSGSVDVSTPERVEVGAARRVGYVIWMGEVPDESAEVANLLIPTHHALESWRDTAPRSGIYGLGQPVMQPVFNTMATGDVLLRVSQKAGGALAKFAAPSYEAHLRDRWQAVAAQHGAQNAEEFWRAALQRE